MAEDAAVGQVPVAPAGAMEAARESLLAGDALRAVDGLQHLDDDRHTVESRQLLAHALLRAGAHAGARAQLDRLVAGGSRDEETLGLQAREAKGRWLLGEPAALAEAQAAYRRAFDATHGTWTGINAATLALLAGDAAEARRLALAVRPLAEAAAAQGGAEGYWAESAVAEACLLLGDVEQARAAYRRAVALAPRAFGHHKSTRDNARMLARAAGLDVETIDALFPRLVVAAFSGHMLDAPGRPAPRFPPADEQAVAQALAAAIDRQGIDVGIAGAACGADILFLEALKAAGREIHIVLPNPPEDFRRISVTGPGGDAWGRRFDRLLEQAEQVTVLAPHVGEDLAHQFHGAVVAGFARLRALAVDGRAVGLAYWDGQPGGVGGAASVLAEWRQHRLPVTVIPRPGTAAAQPAATEADLRQANGQRVVAILFGDAVGFSRLPDVQVKRFYDAFWGRVAGVLRAAPGAPVLFANTWGDGLLVVLRDMGEAAAIALGISRVVGETDWPALGLPAQTQVRIALHAGPAYEVVDPVTGRPGFAGMHVSRAARIEPVTPPGAVYVSEPFAALLALDDPQARFRCEYAGTIPLAKGAGRMRAYRLLPAPRRDWP